MVAPGSGGDAPLPPLRKSRLPATEHPLQVRPGDRRPGRPAVRTVVAEIDLVHPRQQRPNLGVRYPLAGPDRRMAGHGRQAALDRPLAAAAVEERRGLAQRLGGSPESGRWARRSASHTNASTRTDRASACASSSTTASKVRAQRHGERFEQRLGREPAVAQRARRSRRRPRAPRADRPARPGQRPHQMSKEHWPAGTRSAGGGRQSADGGRRWGPRTPGSRRSAVGGGGEGGAGSPGGEERELGSGRGGRGEGPGQPGRGGTAGRRGCRGRGHERRFGGDGGRGDR